MNNSFLWCIFSTLWKISCTQDCYSCYSCSCKFSRDKVYQLCYSAVEYKFILHFLIYFPLLHNHQIYLQFQFSHLFTSLTNPFILVSDNSIYISPSSSKMSSKASSIVSSCFLCSLSSLTKS